MTPWLLRARGTAQSLVDIEADARDALTTRVLRQSGKPTAFWIDPPRTEPVATARRVHEIGPRVLRRVWVVSFFDRLTFLQLFDANDLPSPGAVPVRTFTAPNGLGTCFRVSAAFDRSLVWAASARPNDYDPVVGQGYWVNLECAP